MPAVRCALLAAACAAALSCLVLAPAPAFAAPAAPAAHTAEDASVRALAERLLAENVPADAPGIAVLVARGDRVLYRGARGLADVELGVPLTPQQTFRIGSVTKQFAAAALLKLVEAGKVGLDDPLSKYVPGYPNGEAIKVRHLLDHTSGVKSYTGIDGYMRESIKRELSTQELIAVFKDLPADFAPGQDFRYNNSGYVLLGAVIEAASGQPWHEYLRRSLLQPLKLEHTRYGDVHALIPGMVNGYTRRDDAVAPMDFLDMSQPHAAGALVSTLDDLLRWNRALHGGKAIGAADYTAMTTAHGKAQQGAYGYGYGIGRTAVRGRDGYAHSGGIFGFASYLLYLPEREITVAVLSNSDTGAPGSAGLEPIVRKLAAAALGDPYPPALAVAEEPRTLRQAEGVYRQAVPARSWALRADGGGLSIQRIGGGAAATLTAVGAGEFVYPNGIARLKLVRDAAGAVTAVDYFEDGTGTAQRSERSQEALPPR
ncbi:serine hydrolase domain-containing protein [Lysobacter enzymogenes]|uniref:serine hydrolase domain-containing protein n=1 Tax=Lysobacter enzymogenes TaxID=69 RepID=UPI001A973F04|nr:serine hydrolase domain-containing protein [Lysobacter enzymogenes]QQP94749.1 beta-lactamase family protein [Lysobacter enzymogenes]